MIRQFGIPSARAATESLCKVSLHLLVGSQAMCLKNAQTCVHDWRGEPLVEIRRVWSTNHFRKRDLRSKVYRAISIGIFYGGRDDDPLH